MFEKARGANVVKYEELVLQVEVNGSEENPIFTFLKSSLPDPSDPKVVVVVILMLVHFTHEHKKTFLSDLFFKGKSPGESEVHQLGSGQKVNQK